MAPSGAIFMAKYSMRLTEIITEREFKKGVWELLISDADKLEVSDTLMRLVSTAYAKTTMGSFIRTRRDVLPSDWQVIDFDDDPELDAVIFYRGPRSSERWAGHKIQGLGHDGSRQAKDRAINRISSLLATPGWWVESSHAMRSVLLRVNAPAVTDQGVLRQLFNDPELRMTDRTTYTRQLTSGETVEETVFGKPKLR
jgi:hypothetical protein